MATTVWFFSKSQSELATSVLDRIVPANETMPGAGQIAVAYLDEIVGQSPRLKRSFGAGLSQIEVYANRTYAKDFHNLSDEHKDAVLSQVETDQPEFFQALVRQTYNGYYSDSRIIELLGLEARPPQPRGHELESGDLGLIENVKNRGIAYRQV